MSKKRYRKLEVPGRFTTPPEFTVRFDGKSYTARAGESLALTLLAHGVYVVGRSSKYHRPRGAFCGRGECGHCLAQVNDLPNQRLCRCQSQAELRVESQNVVGTAQFDLLSTLDWLFPQGLDHHHLMIESKTLNRVALAMAHELSGLGRLPPAPTDYVAPHPERRKVEVAVVGCGAAGRAAFDVLRAAGREVVVIDSEPVTGDGVLGGLRVIGYYDERYLVAVGADRLLWLEADQVVLATGGVEQLPQVPGNDLPGIFSRRLTERALAAGILPGQRVVVAAPKSASSSTRNCARALVMQLLDAGADVPATLGLGSNSGAALSLEGGLGEVEGQHRVRAVHADGGGDVFSCDALIWCGPIAPAYELPRQMGLSTPYQPTQQGFVPEHQGDGRTAQANVFVAGEVTGIEADQAAAHGAKVAQAVLASRTAGASSVEVRHARA